MSVEVKTYEHIIYKVYEELNRHVGSENSISAEDLCGLFPTELYGYSSKEDRTVPDVRKLRRIIRLIRRSDEFEKVVGSCKNGYYICTKEDAKKAIDRLMNSAKNQFKTANIMAKKVGLNGQLKIDDEGLFDKFYMSLGVQEGKIPSVGERVYCLYDDVILESRVYALGETSFILDCLSDVTICDSWEWEYADYNKTWFTDIFLAKKCAIELYKANHEGCGRVSVAPYWRGHYQVMERGEMKEYREERGKYESNKKAH